MRNAAHSTLVDFWQNTKDLVEQESASRREAAELSAAIERAQNQLKVRSPTSLMLLAAGT